MFSDQKSQFLPIVHTWEAWGKIFTDTQIWQAAIQEICRRASIHFERLQTGYPGTNAVFIVNRTHVVKIYAPFCRADYEIESELLMILSQNDTIPSPQVMMHGILEDRILWPYIVMEYLPGQSIREVRNTITENNLLEITSQMGSIVHALHQTPLSSISCLDSSINTWHQFCDKQIDVTVIKLLEKHVLPEQIIQAIPEFVMSKIAEQNSKGQVQLSLVHGDLTEDHWLLQKTGGKWKISGLLDFADSRIRPPIYELAALWFGALDRKRASLETFMRRYDTNIKIDDDFLSLAMAYTFLHEYSTEIIEYVLPIADRNDITSIEHLYQLLWQPEV